MKRILLTLALLLFPALASAQCNGVFPSNTVCGSIPGGVPKPTSPAGFQGSAGGSNGQIQYNNAGALGGITTPSGDVTISVPSGVMTIQNKTGNGNKNATSTGTLINGNCVKIDANGNLVDAGTTCTGQSVGACDVTQVTGATSITSGAATLTVVGANFQTTDIGKVIAVPGAGPVVNSIAGTLNTTIIGRTSATVVTLNSNAGSTLSAVSKTVTYGTDDTSAFQTALNDTTAGLLSFSRRSGVGCMITNTLTASVSKTITAGSSQATLFYRQLAGTTIKSLFTVSANGLNFDSFWVDADGGSVVTTTTKAQLFEIANKQIFISNLIINGNSAAQSQSTMGGFGNIGSGSFIVNNTITDIASIPIQGGCGQSKILIQGNRVERGPKLSNGTGFVSFLCSGTVSAQGDIRVIGNTLDMSSLSVADMNVGIYFFGGNSAPAFWFQNIVVSGNVIVGTAGGTASTTGGVIMIQASDVAITGNDIRYTGECIGSGADRAVIVGNSLLGCGTYGMELSGTGINVSGNLLADGGQSPFGMSIGNCNYCIISNNTILATTAPNNYRGIYIYATTGNSSNGSVLNGNTIIASTQSGIHGIYYDCQTGSSSCINNTMVGNNVSGGALSSYGIRIESVATASFGWLIGPSTLGQAIGVSAAAGAGQICYITGMNRSTTKTAGGAFPGTCA